MRNNILSSFGSNLLGGARSNTVAAIVATIRPTMAALTDAQTPADGFAAGTYAPATGDIASAVVTYLVNGQVQAGSYALTAGDTVTAAELVTDTEGNSKTFYASASVTPSVALANTAAPAIIGTPEVGQVVTASGDTWAGSAERSFIYQWTRDGADIPGADAISYTITLPDVGTNLACRILANDGFTQASATSPSVYVEASTDWAFTGSTVNGIPAALSGNWSFAGSNVTSIPGA